MSSPHKYLIIVISAIAMYASVANAAKYSLKPSISSQAVYDDNLFMTTPDGDDVVRLTVTPKLSAIISERDWQQTLDLRAAANLYSDSTLDNNDAYLTYSGVLVDERSSFSLNAGYTRDSSLNTASEDFGLADNQVKSTIWNIGPGYQYRWSEQLSLSLSLNRSNKEYDENVVTGFVGYQADTASASASWSFNQRTRSSLQMRYTDYESDTGSFSYELLSTSIGINHVLSEIWRFDGSYGRSIRNSTSRNVDPFTLFGQTINVISEIDVESTDAIYDLSLSGTFETNEISMSYIRNDQTDSFGGLNEVRYTRVNFVWRPVERWTYSLGARHDVVEAVSRGAQDTDRTLDTVSLSAKYAMARNWYVNAKYMYRERQFANIVSSSTPKSNSIILGLSYVFPEISSD